MLRQRQPLGHVGGDVGLEVHVQLAEADAAGVQCLFGFQAFALASASHFRFAGGRLLAVPGRSASWMRGQALAAQLPLQLAPALPVAVLDGLELRASPDRPSSPSGRFSFLCSMSCSSPAVRLVRLGQWRRRFTFSSRAAGACRRRPWRRPGRPSGLGGGLGGDRRRRRPWRPGHLLGPGVGRRRPGRPSACRRRWPTAARPPGGPAPATAGPACGSPGSASTAISRPHAQQDGGRQHQRRRRRRCRVASGSRTAGSTGARRRLVAAAAAAAPTTTAISTDPRRGSSAVRQRHAGSAWTWSARPRPGGWRRRRRRRPRWPSRPGRRRQSRPLGRSAPSRPYRTTLLPGRHLQPVQLLQ